MPIIEYIQTNPLLSVVIISIIITSIMTALRYFITDRELMRDIKEKQKAIREEMKRYKDNAEKLSELNKQMMEQFPVQMKQSLKLMLITIVPMIIIFTWLRKTFALTTMASTWIWWYIGFSMAFSITLGKILKLD